MSLFRQFSYCIIIFIGTSNSKWGSESNGFEESSEFEESRSSAYESSESGDDDSSAKTNRKLEVAHESVRLSNNQNDPNFHLNWREKDVDVDREDAKETVDEELHKELVQGTEDL